MNIDNIKTPAYVIDESALRRNLEILKDVRERSGAHIVLAQKAFSNYYFYPMIAKYIDGTTASGLYEAKLGKLMGGENHVYSPAYKPEDMDEISEICDHVIFNSRAQYQLYAPLCIAKNVSVGVRINPEYSTQTEHEIYDPCSASSRLGIRRKDFDISDYEGLEGLHMHTLCEQNSDDLISTFKVFEENFAEELKKVRWLNLGGGHHITRADYDREALIELIKYIRETYKVEVILEPGEAIALNAGYLICEVLDKVRADKEVLILDASAACHMPDVLEMPYTPPLKDSIEGGKYTYILSSNTCLAGDIIGTYSFDREIGIGERLVFEDMAIYSMVKNNTFNGIPLPDIDVLHEDGSIDVIKRFGYEDFKGRLS